MKKEINNESQQNVIEKEKDEGEFLMVILGILVLPLIIAKSLTLSLSTRDWIWRLKEKTIEFLFASLISTPIAISFLYFGVKLIFGKSYLVGSFLLICYWIFLIPLSLLMVNFQLSKIASDISEYRFPIKYLGATQRAMLENAFNRAHRVFCNFNYLLPLYTKSGKAVLGVDAQPIDYRWRKLKKDLPEHNVLSSIVEKDLVFFNQEKNSPKSQLVIGGTGSGKTRLLSRMALAALADDWRVVILDFKGGLEEKNEFLSLTSFFSDRKIGVVTYPGMPIDMFRGSTVDIADRLVSCLPAPTGGDGDYHRQRAIRAINAVVVRTGARPPSNVEEVIDRIRNGEAYANDELDREMFRQKEKGVPVGQILAESIASRFEPLRKGGDWSTSGGFSWSDKWDLAVFSLDATREQEVRLGDLILMDFDMWLKSKHREDQPKPILLICDEAGVLEKLPLGSVNLLNIVARGRSSRVGVVIASQTLASLGNNYVGLNEQIGSKWIGRTTNPEELINTIGTKEVVEASYEWQGAGWDIPKSGRQQRAYIVDPDVIRGLRTFYWNVSEAGKTRFIYAPPLRPKK